eukprot:3467233-Rhodomonas_salina.1
MRPGNQAGKDEGYCQQDPVNKLPEVRNCDRRGGRHSIPGASGRTPKNTHIIETGKTRRKSPRGGEETRVRVGSGRTLLHGGQGVEECGEEKLEVEEPRRKLLLTVLVLPQQLTAPSRARKRLGLAACEAGTDSEVSKVACSKAAASPVPLFSSFWMCSEVSSMSKSTSDFPGALSPFSDATCF